MNFKPYFVLLFFTLVGVQLADANPWRSLWRSGAQHNRQSNTISSYGYQSLFGITAIGLAGTVYAQSSYNTTNILSEPSQKIATLSDEPDEIPEKNEDTPTPSTTQPVTREAQSSSFYQDECFVEYRIGHYENSIDSTAKEYKYKDRKKSCNNMLKFLAGLHRVDEGTANPHRNSKEDIFKYDRAIFPMVVKHPYTKQHYPFNYLWQRDVDNHKMFMQLAHDEEKKGSDLVPYFQKMALNVRAIDLIYRGNRHIACMTVHGTTQNFTEGTKPLEYIKWLQNNMQKNQSNL